MNGSNYLLDTNFIWGILKSNPAFLCCKRIKIGNLSMWFGGSPEEKYLQPFL